MAIYTEKGEAPGSNSGKRATLPHCKSRPVHFLFKMIKAIIFDVGGVILDMKHLLRKFIRIFKPKNTKKFWNEISIAAIPLCKNEMSQKKFWRLIAKFNGLNPKTIPSNLWTKDYKKLTNLNKGVMKIIEELKSNFKLAVISNSIPFHLNSMRRIGLYNMFDIVILSHDVNLTKDEKEIFLMTASKLKVKPSECIFIDDVKDFVNVAKSVGMKGIKFKNIVQLKSSLGKILK